MTLPSLDPHLGWSAIEIAADQALAASTRALRQADGLLDPALDDIFERPRAARHVPITSASGRKQH